MKALAELREKFSAYGMCGPHNALISIEEEIDALLADALATMRRAADTLAEHPEYETLTQSLRSACASIVKATAP